MGDPTKRFSSRAENYARYRPGYPAEVLELLKDRCGLDDASVIADVGSGTGNLARLFLENGNKVFGIEPNDEMRRAGERLLDGSTSFESVAGTAEETTLGEDSVDFVTVGQAFHWFDVGAARREFGRVLKPGGWVALIWNARRKDTPFLADYERLLETYATDLETVKKDRADKKVLGSFFGPGGYEMRLFQHHQTFDREGLRGRLLSSSFTPEEDHPNYRPMLEELEQIFRAHEEGGTVAFEYEARVYYGRL